MSDSKDRDHLLSSSTYDILKRWAQIGLPALGTLYFALSQIWGLPYGEQVVGTIVALDAFLGILLGYSSASYNNSTSKYDGALDIQQTDGKKVYSLTLNSEPELLDQKQQVIFKVENGEF
jgi:hypothetical protein